MQTYFSIIPIDRTMIKTQLRIHPDLFDDPAAYIRKHDIPIRTFKPSKGKSVNGPTRNLTLDVLTYKGIKVNLRKVANNPLTEATIDFNPGVCLHGHNGLVISLTEFLDALAILVTQLKPLLSNPDDWIDLVPGLRSRGVAFWDCLEIFLHCSDHDGRLLAGFRNAQRNNSQTPIRHWPESMLIGGKSSNLKFGIYRKAVEMVEHGKLPDEKLEDYRHILRLEVRLKGDKLVRYLGNERNVEEIDGVERLVRFYPQHPIEGHRMSFGELHGVFFSDAPIEWGKPNDQLGRLLARVELDPRTSQTLQDLLAQIRFYTGASSDTMAKIRKAGLEELSRMSAISKDELFSDDAYRTQHSVRSEEREKKVLHELEDAFVHRLISEAYRPPGQPFKPVTRLPSYLRV